MRLTAIILLCLPVACAGALYNRMHRQRAMLLRRLSLFFGALRRAGKGGGATLASLLESCAEVSGADPVFLRALGEQASPGPQTERWAAAVSACPGAQLLTKSERETLLRFGDALNETSLSAFTETCAEYERIFAEAYGAAAAKCRTTEKLSLTGSLLVSALLFILLL